LKNLHALFAAIHSSFAGRLILLWKNAFGLSLPFNFFLTELEKPRLLHCLMKVIEINSK